MIVRTADIGAGVKLGVETGVGRAGKLPLLVVVGGGGGDDTLELVPVSRGGSEDPLAVVVVASRGGSEDVLEVDAVTGAGADDMVAVTFVLDVIRGGRLVVCGGNGGKVETVLPD